MEKALDQQETALSVFLDIVGAFNNTSYDSKCDAIFKHGVDYIIICDGLQQPWRTIWLRQISTDIPRGLWYLGVAHREVFCHRSYGAC